MHQHSYHNLWLQHIFLHSFFLPALVLLRLLLQLHHQGSSIPFCWITTDQVPSQVISRKEGSQMADNLEIQIHQLLLKQVHQPPHLHLPLPPLLFLGAITSNQDQYSLHLGTKIIQKAMKVIVTSLLVLWNLIQNPCCMEKDLLKCLAPYQVILRFWTVEPR